RTVRSAQYGDVPKNARQPPLILVLEVTHRGPLVDPNQDHILARTDYVGDIELLNQPATLANSDLYAVQPDAVDRFHPVEAKQHPLSAPLRKLEATAMITCRVLIGNMR